MDSDEVTYMPLGWRKSNLEIVQWLAKEIFSRALFAAPLSLAVGINVWKMVFYTNISFCNSNPKAE